MGFPSPAMDYIEDRPCLNRLFVHHPAATSFIEFGGLNYVVDAALTPRDGDTLCYEMFGELAIGKMMGGCIITPDGESIEGEALSEVIVMGKVILTITQHYDWGRPTI
ncbi:DNA polymerase V [Erwinia rhapontici]|uniref:phage repressor protein n=1 Tax=Erwinia rhapontici TaxID=55212 RepID=UPI003D35E975